MSALPFRLATKSERNSLNKAAAAGVRTMKVEDTTVALLGGGSVDDVRAAIALADLALGRLDRAVARAQAEGVVVYCFHFDAKDRDKLKRMAMTFPVGVHHRISAWRIAERLDQLATGYGPPREDEVCLGIFKALKYIEWRANLLSGKMK